MLWAGSSSSRLFLNTRHLFGKLGTGECSPNPSELQEATPWINLIPFRGREGAEKHPASSAHERSALLEMEPKYSASSSPSDWPDILDEE